MSFTNQVIKTVKQIPRGKVATYSQIAALVGSPKAARTVGWVLARTAKDLPWHRVVNSKGQISIINMNFPAELQSEMLIGEGVGVEKLSHCYCVNLNKYLWQI